MYSIMYGGPMDIFPARVQRQQQLLIHTTKAIIIQLELHLQQ